MPPIAARLRRIEESGTVKLTDAVARLRKAGRDVVSLSVGEPDFPSPPEAVEAAKAALDAGHTKYVSAWGLPELREEVAARSREGGIPCAAENVLVTPAKQAILYAILGLVEDGDEVILPDPAWVSYAPLVVLAGGRVVRVPTRMEDGFRLDPEAVAARVTPRTRMIVLNSPANPTGAVMDAADVRAIADLARDRDLWVLSDELYDRIVYEGAPLSPASLPGMAERTLVVNGMSKAHAMTGWRVGWLVAAAPVLRDLVKLQQHSLTHAPAFAQRGALAALRAGPAYTRRMVGEFRARRDLVVEGLRAIPGWTCDRPRGAFYVFARYAHPLLSLAMAERLLEAGVAVTPGIEFGPAGEGHVRLSYATGRDVLREGLARIRRATEALPGPTPVHNP
ncbi:MAG TPA: pyridoxal phosphate-dependent aminotransferase [Candidatus Thermoplasmatota archaeon]|nr:pyridoxal phosphate-dependent aminotransferase [Candidatus Thermoplasmatota archaeon]